MSEDKKNKSLSDRKTDHLELTKKSQVEVSHLNKHFTYEPLLKGFPRDDFRLPTVTIAGKSMRAPIWISSMTGGTGPAAHVNQNLAKACGEYGLGMGLGSCRILLESDEYFSDFALRPLLGEKCPFFANIGIAQVASMMRSGIMEKFVEICKKLEVDGFFIHINPLQEWYQPNGDRWFESPIQLIDDVLGMLEGTGLALGVKEVGQGMGPRSLEQLLIRPIACIEFAAFGGTNFSYLEALRGEKERVNNALDLCFVGHSADEMLIFANRLKQDLGEKTCCGPLIISGGVRSFLQGYSLISQSLLPAAYGMAGPFLEVARQGTQETLLFVERQVEGLKMANQFLQMRKE